MKVARGPFVCFCAVALTYAELLRATIAYLIHPPWGDHPILHRRRARRLHRHQVLIENVLGQNYIVVGRAPGHAATGTRAFQV